jgi:quercetin dioxygenase-like cupin family protein
MRAQAPTSAVWFAGARVVVRVRAGDSDGRLGIWESEESRGDALPLHVHRREDEQVVVLDGEVFFHVGGAVHRLRGGETLALPRDVPHAHAVASASARILTVATPGGFEALFDELGVPAPPGSTAPPPPDRRTLAAAAGRLAVEVVGPPPGLGAP